jgi:hypothetical protein
MIVDHKRNNTDTENRCIWRGVLIFNLSTTNSTRGVLASKEVLAMRGPRLTSATAPSVLTTNARCQPFFILFLASCILLSHGSCSKFEYKVGTIPLFRACRRFPLFIKEHLTTVVGEMLRADATKPGFFHSRLSRHCQNEKCAAAVKSFTRMLDSKKIFAVYI